MENNKQQTAVDSIIEFCQKQMHNHYSISHNDVCSSIIKFCQEQAKEMEKNNIIDFTNSWFQECCTDLRVEKWPKQYYLENLNNK
jgi:hypothetical protein